MCSLQLTTGPMADFSAIHLRHGELAAPAHSLAGFARNDKLMGGQRLREERDGVLLGHRSYASQRHAAEAQKSKVAHEQEGVTRLRAPLRRYPDPHVRSSHGVRRRCTRLLLEYTLHTVVMDSSRGFPRARAPRVATGI